jgi:hypothetical protein
MGYGMNSLEAGKQGRVAPGWKLEAQSWKPDIQSNNIKGYAQGAEGLKNLILTAVRKWSYGIHLRCILAWFPFELHQPTQSSMPVWLRFHHPDFQNSREQNEGMDNTTVNRSNSNDPGETQVPAEKSVGNQNRNRRKLTFRIPKLRWKSNININ